jgi:hypothetical protein
MSEINDNSENNNSKIRESYSYGMISTYTGSDDLCIRKLGGNKFINSIRKFLYKIFY